MKVKIGFRKPSVSKRVVARTSIKRAIRHRAGLKVPRGMGWLTDPRKAVYNRIYYRTTRGCLPIVLLFAGAAAVLAWFVL